MTPDETIGQPKLVKTPVAYAMSRDYEALYDLLCAGGEALGTRTSNKTGTKKVAPVLLRLCSDGGFDFQQGWDDTGKQYAKSQFIAECTRLSLEWIAPVDVAEVIKAGKRLVTRANEMERTLEAMDEGQFTAERDNYKQARKAWISTTKPFRP